MRQGAWQDRLALGDPASGRQCTRRGGKVAAVAAST